METKELQLNMCLDVLRCYPPVEVAILCARSGLVPVYPYSADAMRVFLDSVANLQGDFVNPTDSTYFLARVRWISIVATFILIDGLA